VRIAVDPAACDGFGYCAEMLPELLSRDEWGFPIVIGTEVPDELVKAARQAARLCPRRAFSLHPQKPKAALQDGH
jgi:ferredoxin